MLYLFVRLWSLLCAHTINICLQQNRFIRNRLQQRRQFNGSGDSNELEMWAINANSMFIYSSKFSGE